MMGLTTAAHSFNAGVARVEQQKGSSFARPTTVLLI